MNGQLSGSRRNTCDAVFRHPAVRHLAWGDVRSMLGSLAEVAREPNGDLKVTRNGQMPAPHASPDRNLY